MSWTIEYWDSFEGNIEEAGITTSCPDRPEAIERAKEASYIYWYSTFAVRTPYGDISALVYRNVEFIPVGVITRYYGDRFSEIKDEQHEQS